MEKMNDISDIPEEYLKKWSVMKGSSKNTNSQ